jgi:hypothetical protein
MPAPFKVAINCFLAICIALILLTSCIQSSAIALFVVWVYNISYSMSPSYKVYDSQISSLAAASILSITTTMLHSFLTLFSYCVVSISSRKRTRLIVYIASGTLSVLSVIQPLVVLSYTAVIGLSIVAYICVMSIISVIVHCFVTFYVYEIKPFWNKEN